MYKYNQRNLGKHTLNYISHMKVIHVVFFIDRSGSVATTLGSRAGEKEARDFITEQQNISKLNNKSN